MNISRFRLVTFDLTDTLLKFRTAPGKKYAEIAEQYGLHCDKDTLSENFKVQWKKMNKEHPNFGLKSGLGWEMWWKIIVIGTFKDSKINLCDKKLDSIATDLIDVYQTPICWEQSYGALGILSYLRNKNVPLGVISNFDPRIHKTLVNNKLRHYFKFVIASYEMGIEKPHPEIFRKAMELSEVENLHPNQCLHVGNTASLDYEGAKNCGWNAVLINDENLSKDEMLQKHPFVDTKDIYSNLYELHKTFVENSNININMKNYSC